ncbi:MAG: hypothetical protein V1724_03700 [Chloroflexota bacterium]
MVTVDSAEVATDIAVTFIKKYKQLAIPLAAHREEDLWVVTLDVGALIVKIATVRIEAATGTIKDYKVPP